MGSIFDSLFDLESKEFSKEFVIKDLNVLSEKWWKGYIWLLKKGDEAIKNGYANPAGVPKLSEMAEKFDREVDIPLMQTIQCAGKFISQDEIKKIFDSHKK